MSQSMDKLGAAIAALGRNDFPVCLATFLRGCAAYDNLSAFGYRGQAKPIILHTVYATASVYDSLDEYVDAAYLLDPFFRAHLARVPPGIYALRDVAPDQFKRSAYYRSYYKKTTIVDEICAIAYTASGHSVQVSMGKDHTSGRPFSKREFSELKMHEPVICALMEQHWAQLEAEDTTGSGDPAHHLSLPDQLIAALKRDRGVSLSVRQAEVALLILQGHSSASIALKLGISPQTVKVHRKLLYAKCEICSQAELFAMVVPIMAVLRAQPSGAAA